MSFLKVVFSSDTQKRRCNCTCTTCWYGATESLPGMNMGNVLNLIDVKMGHPGHWPSSHWAILFWMHQGRIISLVLLSCHLTFRFLISLFIFSYSPHYAHTRRITFRFPSLCTKRILYYSCCHGYQPCQLLPLYDVCVQVYHNDVGLILLLSFYSYASAPEARVFIDCRICLSQRCPRKKEKRVSRGCSTVRRWALHCVVSFFVVFFVSSAFIRLFRFFSLFSLAAGHSQWTTYLHNRRNKKKRRKETADDRRQTKCDCNTTLNAKEWQMASPNFLHVPPAFAVMNQRLKWVIK